MLSLKKQRKLNNLEVDVNNSNYDKVYKAKNLLESMRQKLQQIDRLTQERIVDVEMEYRAIDKLKRQRQEMEEKKQNTITQIKELKLLNFKLWKAQHDLSRTVSGKVSSTSTSINKSNKHIKTWRNDKGIFGKSLVKSRSLKRLFSKKSKDEQ